LQLSPTGIMLPRKSISMNYTVLLAGVKTFINELYVSNDERRLPFHNFSHSTEIISVLKQLSDYYKLDEKARALTEIAAWFSQAGFITADKGNPGMKSVLLAEDFLAGQEIAQEDKDIVTGCVKAALGIKQATTALEQIVSDAVTHYFGTPSFKELNKLRRKEHELIYPGEKVKKDWVSKSVEMLETHQFYTEYAHSLFDAGKKTNLEKLTNRQQEKTAAPPVLEPAADGQQTIHSMLQSASAREKIKYKQKDPVRGIEMMFRISSSNNVRVSVMADNKSHIMITVNSIIISVVLGLIVKNIDTHTELIIPSLILLIVNVLTIIYSVLATRPGYNAGVFTQEQVEKKSVNMLFFGSFYNMGFEEYSSAIKKVMTDSEFLYSCLIKDLYWQGRVLGKKYKLLRKAYTIFLYGIIISVVAFAIGGLFS
jgi:hypothetical protein